MRRVLPVAMLLAFAPASFGGELEIYVLTGPDGVEIFSNLPRAPLARQEVPLAASTPWQPPRQDNGGNFSRLDPEEGAGPGKNFLHDD